MKTRTMFFITLLALALFGCNDPSPTAVNESAVTVYSGTITDSMTVTFN